MVELLGGFPIREVVALQAVVSKLSFVGVFVTGNAILRQTEERFGEVFHFDEGAFGTNHIHGRVALLASRFRVFSFEFVTCEPMIKLLLGRLPVDEIEILAVVLAVTPNAIFPVRIAHLYLVVVSVLGPETACDFFVTVETLERWGAGSELMAARALGRSAERFVGLRQWTG